MDVLANVLNVTQVGTHMLGVLEFVPPWGILVNTQEKCIVHIVRGGACWLRLNEYPDPIAVQAGDLILTASGGSHTLASDLNAKLEPCEQAVARAHGGVVESLSRSTTTAARERTIIQCAGYLFAHEKRTHPLISLLPPVIHIRAQQAAGDTQLQYVLGLLLQESNQRDAGHELVAPRLIDTLLVYVLRLWLREQPEGSCGWLGALRDPQIRKALGLIHESPQSAWTVEQLARAVAMSRAAFARRFTELVGEPPLAYITRWRMDLAAKLLRDSREPVGTIGARVGYVSETAFAKAFRRYRKISPREYRLASRATAVQTNAPAVRAAITDLAS